MAYASKTFPLIRIGVVPGQCCENAENGSSHFPKRLLCYFESTLAQQYGTQAMWLERQLQVSSGAFGDTTAISESFYHVDQQQYWEFKDASACSGNLHLVTAILVRRMKGLERSEQI